MMSVHSCASPGSVLRPCSLGRDVPEDAVLAKLGSCTAHVFPEQYPAHDTPWGKQRVNCYGLTQQWFGAAGGCHLFHHGDGDRRRPERSPVIHSQTGDTALPCLALEASDQKTQKHAEVSRCCFCMHGKPRPCN